VTAAQRARWLAELSDALHDAQQLIWRFTDDRNLEALDLLKRIEAARAQMQSLQLGRARRAADDFYPEWTNSLPWDCPAEDRRL
jgi:hypothetical protein